MILAIALVALATSAPGAANARGSSSVPALPHIDLPNLPSPRVFTVGDGCIALAGYSQSDDIVVVREDTFEVAATIPGTTQGDILFHGLDLFVPVPAQNRIDRYAFTANCASHTISQFPLDDGDMDPISGPEVLVWASQRLWVTGTRSESFTRAIAKLDPATGKVTAYTGNYGGSLASIDAAPSTIFVCGQSVGTVQITAGVPSSPTVASGGCDDANWAVAEDGSQVYLNDVSDVAIVDPTDGSWLDTVGNTGNTDLNAIGAGTADDTVVGVTFHQKTVPAETGLWIWSTDTGDVLTKLRLEIPTSAWLVVPSSDGTSNYILTSGLDNSSVSTMWKLPAQPRSPELSVKAKKTITIGSKVKVTAHLGVFADATDRTISIYQKPFNKPQTLLKTGTVDANGNLSVTSSPTVNTTYTVSYAGEGDVLPESAHSIVGVAPRLRTKVLGSSGRQGQYFVFQAGQTAGYTLAVSPNHRGESVQFTLERFSHARWRTIGELELLLRRDSTQTVAVQNLRGGARYRINVEFYNDKDHAGATSLWSYFLAR